MIDDYRRIATITKPHGLKGAVKAYPTTDDESRFDAGNTCYLRTKHEDILLTIEKSSKFKNLFILTFDKYHDINDIEKYKGCDLIVPKSDEDDLGKDEYYVDDLVDIEVSDENGCALGKIIEVMTTGANDVYVVNDGKKEILIPAIHECVLEVSIADKRMKVHLPKGL